MRRRPNLRAAGGVALIAGVVLAWMAGAIAHVRRSRG
jgi:hypothetical protein